MGDRTQESGMGPGVSQLVCLRSEAVIISQRTESVNSVLFGLSVAGGQNCLCKYKWKGRSLEQAPRSCGVGDICWLREVRGMCQHGVGEQGSGRSHQELPRGPVHRTDLE